MIYTIYILGKIYILYMTEQVNIMGNDLPLMSLEELKAKDQFLKVLCEERRKDKSRDYPLTEQERNTWDIVRFFITKKEHENDKISSGDCFHTSWGYDQTNVEMYKVVGMTKSGKSAIIRQIGMKTKPQSENFMSDCVIPDPGCELKRTIYNEETHITTNSEENKPDLKVRLTRSHSFNPITKEHEAIGEIYLRGSVYYAGEEKHLQNLYPIKIDESTSRSWYA